MLRIFVANREERTRGSVAVTMMVLMVLALLSVGVIARTLSSQKAVRTNQDFNAGLAGADGGVSDALFQLDQGQSSTFTNAGHAGNSAFSYTATRVDANTYKITSKGTVNGVAHQVVATASRDLRFDYTIFGVTSIDFNGNCNGTPVPAMGSSGSINTNGNGTCALHYDCYLPGHGPCPPSSQNGRILNQSDPQSDPVVPTSGTQPCPAGGTFPATINGLGGTPFVCSTANQTVSFQSMTTVTNGPVIIYVTTGSVDPGCGTINSGGTAVNFQLYVTPSENWTWNGSCRTNITGAIYAPHASITVDGGKFDMTGAIVADQARINGVPNSAFTDVTLNSIVVTNWRVSSYHEVSSKCVSNC
jgi:Tfp pilus assembly protein PilX